MDNLKALATRVWGHPVVKWLTKVTALRISMGVALVFCVSHVVIQLGIFEHGPLSKKGLIHTLDLKSLDLKFVGRDMEEKPEPQVVIAAIDEKGMEKFGLWPWSRRVMGDFVNAATKGGASVIAFDAIFADEDRNSSYVSIKRFLDEFESQGLGGEKEALTVKAQASLKSVDETLSTQLAQLEKRVRQSKGPNKAAILAAIKKLKVKKPLQDAQESLQTLNERSRKYYRAMQREITTISPDEQFAQALKNSPQTVLGLIGFYNESELQGLDSEKLAHGIDVIRRIGVKDIFELGYIETGGQALPMIRPVDVVDWDRLQVRKIKGMLAPLPKFSEVTQSFGYFNVSPDADGVFRRIRLLNRYENVLFPSLTLASLAQYYDTEFHPLDGEFYPGRTLSGVALGTDIVIPTNMQGHLLINYYGRPESYFPTYSISDIIDGTVPPEKYQGKIVLVGMTAMGWYDLRATPFSPNTPGVYIHASAIQSAIDGNFVERFFGIVLVEALLYLLLGLAMGLVLPKLKIWQSLIATAAIAIGWYVVDVTVMFPSGIWTLNVLPTIEAFFIFIGVAVHGYLTEGREKRKIRKAFQFYLTKSVVDEMLTAPEKLKLGGERRDCTVLFSDVRGFTTISERLTPEELVHLLNSYLTPMTDLVFKYDGTLDKYMGDAIMAIFGAPVGHADHAARGCFCALEMMEALGPLQEGWRAEGLPEIDIGIGLNTGPMSVGNMGSEIRFDYTVMGDNVNLGSRLEGINKQYGTNIIISEYTRVAAGDAIHAREIDAVRVKGKTDPVIIYELLGRDRPNAEAQVLISTFEDGIRHYKQQKWDEAIAIFEKVRTEIKQNDYTSGMYIERCQTMKQNLPGENWDGVFTMTTK